MLVLGESHPLSTMSSLASTNFHQSKYSEATVLYKQCFDGRKAVLGESHPDTLTTMISLADAYVHQEAAAQNRR